MIMIYEEFGGRERGERQERESGMRVAWGGVFSFIRRERERGEVLMPRADQVEMKGHLGFMPIYIYGLVVTWILNLIFFSLFHKSHIFFIRILYLPLHPVQSF